MKDLEKIHQEAKALVKKAGLDPYPVIFGVVDWDQLNEISAYDGFLERYPHWLFGMRYDWFRKRSAYGGLHFYELVLNTNPAIAYLRSSNRAVENKAVMIHVYAHADFFKNNRWFSKTPKGVISLMRNHASRIEEYMNKHGVAEVESFIDKALSIQYNIDQHSLFIKRRWEPTQEELEEVSKLPVKRDYMERFINPPQWIESRRRKLEELKKKRKKFDRTDLEKPQKDLLLFLIKYGKLEDWQADILAIIREEAYYFMPQLITKVMNEGWATYWQSKIMAEFAQANEFIDHAEMQSNVLGGLNPYSLGKAIWESIKERWDKGRFGREWEECKDKEKKKRWDTKAKAGLEKIFEVRRNYNDIGFIDEFFTEEIAEKLNLFTYEYIPETSAYHITSRNFEDIKKKLLFLHTNLGRPVIKVKGGNYDNKGELLLIHEWNGVQLHMEEAKKVLKNIYEMWGRPVNLKTIIYRKVKDPDPLRKRINPQQPSTALKEEQGVMLRYDGERIREMALSPDEVEDIKYDEVDYNTIPKEWIG
jgi:stage V sporulation protein R